MIDHKSQVIYIHPCRCAGTSIEMAFGYGSDELNASGERHALPSFYPKKYWKQYSTYISVRNPWDRLLSGFTLIKQHDLPAYKPVMDKYDLSTFNQFIEEVIIQSLLYKKDRMFWPQTEWFYLKDKIIKYDKVIRFENLARDTGSILKKINMTAESLPHSLKTDRPHYRDVYDVVSREIVEDIYRKDIELLRYKF